MQGQKNLAHNLSILTAGQIVSQLANVGALLYLADYLGPHRFGVVQVGVAFMSYALITAEWGMMNLGIREISRLNDRSQIFTYVSEHCGIMAIQAAVIFTLGTVILLNIQFSAYDHVVFILYLATVIPQVYSQSWIAVGIDKIKLMGIFRICRSLTYALLVFLVLPFLDGFAGQSAQRWVPAIFLFAVAAANLTVNIPLVRLFGKFVHPRIPRWSTCRHRWQQTSSVGANNLILRVLYNVDLMLLGILVSPKSAGNYAAAAKIMFFLVVAVEVLWSALLPRLSRLNKESTERFRVSFNLFFGSVAALLLPIALGGWILGIDLVDFLYKGKYTEAGPVFRVLAISYAMLALATFLGNTLLSEDRQKWYLLPLATSSAAAVASIWLLVPNYGILGASWGIIASHGLLLACLTIINFRNFNRLLFETLTAIIPGLLIMAFVLNLVPGWHVLIRVFAGGGVYLLMAALPFLRLRRLSRIATIG